MADRIEIDRAVLQAVFDIAVTSLDFGSGFLDDEEVIALRATAVAIGADPADATPRNFRCKYEHGGAHDWKQYSQAAFGRPGQNHCSRCGAWSHE